MGDRRQPFRFRLPWLSAASVPLLAAEPLASRPIAEARTQAPAQPGANTPIQRPQGMAPAQPPPPQTQAPSPRTEPQVTAPSRATAETRAASQSASPSRPTAQTRVAAMPPSSARVAAKSRVTLQPASPDRGTAQHKAASLPPSPSLGAAESRVTHVPLMTEAVSKSPSMPKQLQTTKEESPQPPPSASLEEQKLAAPRQPSVEAQQKPESTSQSQTPTGTVIQQPPAMAVEHPQASAPVTETAAIFTVAIETHAGSSKLNKREDGMKVEEQGLVHPASEAGKMLQKRQEDATEKPWTTTITDEKKIDAASSTHPEDRYKLNNSHQKHAPVNGELVPLQHGIREDISKFVHKLAPEHPKLPMDEKPGSVLTLTGENRGAFMSLGLESGKKDGSVHIHQGYETNLDDSHEATTDGERSYKGKQSKDSITKQGSASKAYVNSNTQSINNSIVLDCSGTEKNPGVHLIFFHNLLEQTTPNTKSEPIETEGQV